MSKITLKKLLILSDDLVQEWCDITLQNSKGDEINIELDVNESEVHVQYIDASLVWSMYADHHDDWQQAALVSCSLDPDDTDWFVSSGTLIRAAEIGQRSLEMWDTLSRYRRTGD